MTGDLRLGGERPREPVTAFQIRSGKIFGVRAASGIPRDAAFYRALRNAVRWGASVPASR